MSREIEFRAYYKPLKKYLPISSISFRIGAVKGSDPLEIVSLGGVSSFTLYGVERPNVATPVLPESVIIEQFTGLLDRNGKKIYEGDLVKNCDKCHVDSEEVDAVKVTDDAYLLPFRSSFGSWSSELCEVIGNIHESNTEEV